MVTARQVRAAGAAALRLRRRAVAVTQYDDLWIVEAIRPEDSTVGALVVDGTTGCTYSYADRAHSVVLAHHRARVNHAA